jgi:hypothetical protein
LCFGSYESLINSRRAGSKAGEMQQTLQVRIAASAAAV